MKKSIIILLSALLLNFSNIAIEAGTATEQHAIDATGQIWEVLDDLRPGQNYIIIFDTKGDNIIENNEIIRIF